MFKNIILTNLLALALFLLTSCASGDKSEGTIAAGDVGPKLSERKYGNLIGAHTRSNQKYEGFYNKFEASVTFLNSDVQTYILQRKNDVLQWDQPTAQKERERLFQENSTETRFALSLYTPSPRLNDLHKGSSIWKVYLEANGQRYTGRAQKRNGKLEDLQAIFPYHNRWSVPYDIIFPVPLSATESGAVKLILTSSQGTAEFEFK